MIKHLALAVVAAAIGVTAVAAQSDPIAARQAAMKAVGDQNRIATELLDGKRPFSTDAAKQVFTTFADSATRMKTLFPENSKSGGNTKALPSIWEKKADFDAQLDRLASLSKAAAEKTTDLGSFKAGLGEVRKTCGGSHSVYRAKS
jgi:cytochrome c556